MRKLLKLNRIYLLFFLLLFFSSHSIAQNTSEIQRNTNNLAVAGKIVESNGLPLIGAKISAKGTIKETTTNFDGEFILEIENKTILYINYVGFQTIEVPVEPETNTTFVLREKNASNAPKVISRKEMRKIRQKNKNRGKTNKGDSSHTIKSLFYTLKSLSDN